MSNIVKINGWDLELLDGEQERRIGASQQGEKLGYERPRDFKKLVMRNWEELLRYGQIPQRATVARYESRPGIWQERTVKEPMLNEAQALLMCMFANTSTAADIREEVIRAYLVIKRAAETQSFERIRLLEHSVLELMRRIAPDPHGLLGSNARDLRSRISSVSVKRRQLGDPHASLTAVDNEVRMIVDYPRVRGAKWENCPAQVATRAHSYVAAQLDALDKRIKKSARSSQTVIPFRQVSKGEDASKE